MNQIVMNLCLNAVEALKDHGSVPIVTRNLILNREAVRAFPGLKAGPHVCLMVEDNGCGMSPEIRAHVFEPFFTTKFKGRGLGLAAVYGIVKNHGGHILARSEEGNGTTFIVYLPTVKTREVKRALAVAEDLPDIPRGSETILLIDDEEIVLGVTRRSLELLGYRVLTASHGQEAIDLALNHDGPIHLAIMDMSMPILSGPETYPLLIELRPAIKVIIASGYELDDAAQALLDHGALAFLQKPFRLECLGREVRKALDHLDP
jgi:CheY-like chemotaxis protein